MTNIEEVISFSREFINFVKTRTPQRKAKIKMAYLEVMKENMRGGCSTCYIEAIFKIIKFTKMASSKYQLKQGVLLQAFGDASKVMTNANITDDLAEYHLSHNPACAKYFAVLPTALPKAVTPSAPAGITIIVPPEQPKEKKEEKVPEPEKAVVKAKPKSKTQK